MDRAAGGPALVASTQGGMDIEEVAHANPSAIVTQPVDITTGIQTSHTQFITEKLGLKGAFAQDAQSQIGNFSERPKSVRPKSGRQSARPKSGGRGQAKSPPLSKIVEPEESSDSVYSD